MVTKGLGALGYSARIVRAIFAAAGEEDGKAIVGGNAVEIWNPA